VIEKHVAWSEVSQAGAVLEVFGLAGHMGSVDRLDGAITKAATIIRKLVTARQQRGGDWASLAVTLKDRPDPDQLGFEGGQGFLPTHRLEDVADRVRQAARHGVEEYLATVGLPADAIACETRFDKLHNDAFARPADGPAMNAICQAGRDSGVYRGEPIRGWDVSCDARIFAREFPAAEVITFGPGSLSQAHANDEHGDINDVLAAAETLARLALVYGPR
jgi:acetylornithine deacetylase/succinyl-diaminopimelate desuccinylase-like protein